MLNFGFNLTGGTLLVPYQYLSTCTEGASLARGGRAPRISYAGRARPKTHPPLWGVRFLAAALR